MRIDTRTTTSFFGGRGDEDRRVKSRETVLHGVYSRGRAGTVMWSRKEGMFGGIGAVTGCLGGSFATFGGVVGGDLLMFFRSENVFGPGSWSSFGHLLGNTIWRCQNGIKVENKLMTGMQMEMLLFGEGWTEDAKRAPLPPLTMTLTETATKFS